MYIPCGLVAKSLGTMYEVQKIPCFVFINCVTLFCLIVHAQKVWSAGWGFFQPSVKLRGLSFFLDGVGRVSFI